MGVKSCLRGCCFGAIFFKIEVQKHSKSQKGAQFLFKGIAFFVENRAFSCCLACLLR